MAELTEQEKQEIESKIESKELVVKNATGITRTFEDAKNNVLENFKPQYDKDKSIYENAKDVVKTIAVGEAIKDDKFTGDMTKRVQTNIKTDQDTDQIESDIKKQNAYYKQHLPVLQFAKMKEPANLTFMKWVYFIAVVPYMLSLIIQGAFNLVSSVFSGLNDLFNMVFGIPQYLLDDKGNLILDEYKKPYLTSVKINIVTKIIFICALVIIGILIIFALVKGLIGFDIIQYFKDLI